MLRRILLPQGSAAHTNDNNNKKENVQLGRVCVFVCVESLLRLSFKPHVYNIGTYAHKRRRKNVYSRYDIYGATSGFLDRTVII